MDELLDGLLLSLAHRKFQPFESLVAIKSMEFGIAVTTSIDGQLKGTWVDCLECVVRDVIEKPAFLSTIRLSYERPCDLSDGRTTSWLRNAFS